MANPNIVQVASIYGRVAHVADVATGAGSTIQLDPVTPGNAVATGKVVKLNALYVSNTTAGNLTATVTINNGSTDFDLVGTITVPANSTLDVISKSIYLPETYTLKVVASGAGIDALVSWEEMSE